MHPFIPLFHGLAVRFHAAIIIYGIFTASLNATGRSNTGQTLQQTLATRTECLALQSHDWSYARLHVFGFQCGYLSRSFVLHCFAHKTAARMDGSFYHSLPLLKLARQ